MDKADHDQQQDAHRALEDHVRELEARLKRADALVWGLLALAGLLAILAAAGWLQRV